MYPKLVRWVNEETMLPTFGQTGRLESVDDGTQLMEGCRLFIPDDTKDYKIHGGYYCGDDDVELIFGPIFDHNNHPLNFK